MSKSIKHSSKLVIDTSTFFSALYNKSGNEAHLFDLADKGKCSVYILQYVLDELREVFKRKGIDFKLVIDLLDTYHNVFISDLTDLNDKEIKLAKELINDPKDRPIFIFAYRMIRKHRNTYFISGDKGFFKENVKKTLKLRVLTTREFLDQFS